MRRNSRRTPPISIAWRWWLAGSISNASGTSNTSATSNGSGAARTRAHQCDDRRDDEAGARRVDRQAAEHLDPARGEADLLLGLAQRGRDRVGVARARPGRPGKLIWLGWSVRWSVRCVSSTVGSSRRTSGISTDAAPASRSTIGALALISGCPRGRRDEAHAQIAAGAMRSASTGGRWSSSPRTGRSSGLKLSAIEASFCGGRLRRAPRKWLAAARRPARGLRRQASFSLMRADLPERLRR